MITLKNLNQRNAIPAMFDTEKEFIEYTISEATWLSLPTGEIPTMEKWGFKKVVDNTVTDEYSNKEDIFHWESDMDTCLKFWSNLDHNWMVTSFSIKNTTNYFPNENCIQIIQKSIDFLYSQNIILKHHINFCFSDHFLEDVNNLLIYKNFKSNNASGTLLYPQNTPTIDNQPYIVININPATFITQNLISHIIHELVHFIDYSNNYISTEYKSFFKLISEYRAKYYQELFYLKNQDLHTISKCIDRQTSAYTITCDQLCNNPKAANLYYIFHAIAEIKVQEFYNAPDIYIKKNKFKILLNNLVLGCPPPQVPETENLIFSLNRLLNYGTALPIHTIEYF